MQESICLIVDVATALAEGRCTGNTYLVSAAVADKDRDEHQQSRVYVAVTGVHNPDGSIADTVTLNWTVSSLASDPGRRPANQVLDPGRAAGARALLDAAMRSGGWGPVRDAVALLLPTDAPSTAAGQYVPLAMDGQAMSLHDLLDGGALAPVIVDITGQAVTDEVIFPAQYASPDTDTDGWYWSATVDSRKVGIHHYQLHLALFRATMVGDELTWLPEVHTCDAILEVRAVPLLNGFTGAGLGLLPLPPRGWDVGGPA